MNTQVPQESFRRRVDVCPSNIEFHVSDRGYVGYTVYMARMSSQVRKTGKNKAILGMRAVHASVVNGLAPMERAREV